MKKIVISGALGYLGTELCNLYSGESWNSKIVAIDSDFKSERVNQLSKWGIEFVQGEILNKDFTKKYFKDADIVFHLAGITNVAYVRKDASQQLDEKIKTVAIDGTNNILNSISKNCKIIFPSTHVIFEGLKYTKKNISELEKPRPILMYSRSKVQNELDISKSKSKYIILRLGSVYGYSQDSTRINIMPNLFSKITSQNGTIKLFSGGKQLKSLVNLIDVVRCMKFMADQTGINNEIFNLSSEETNVKAVAKICKKIKPDIRIIKTKDETPNLGYSLSNRKLLKTGFKFLYNIEDSIRLMVNKWSYKKESMHLEKIYKGSNKFKDKRGMISNYELPEPINLIGNISSKKGTIRANHYHPVQEQKCLLIKGKFVSVYKDLLNSNENRITHCVKEGDLIVTKPNTAHAMVFTEDSIFLNLVRGEREHKNYGITHTLPYQLVNKQEAKNLLNFYKYECRCCGNENLKRVISLGFQPLANNLLNSEKEKVQKYPLELNYCNKCHNVQLSVSINPKLMFSNYLYLSSTSKMFQNHFKIAANKYIKEFKLKKNSLIIDVGANDGIGLAPFKKRGYNNLLAVEPAKNLCNILRNKELKVFNGFLDHKELTEFENKADLILASNVFAHADKLKEMANSMIKLLKNNGSLVIEVQSLLSILKNLTFDNIYHEHYNYWSLISLNNFFKKLGAKIFNAEKIQTHGGSLRIYVTKNLNKKINKSVKTILKEEVKFGLKNFETYKKFEEKITIIKKNVLSNINKLKKKHKTLIGYGAPAKATTALNYFEINNQINFIVEDNKLKQGKILPGVNIKIKSNLKNKKIIVFAWNFYDEIKKKNKQYSKNFLSLKDLFVESI